MLVLTRQPDQKILLKLPTGEEVTITVLRVKGRYVRIGIAAPESVRILRDDCVSQVRK
jgi:carbon storage regulator CsrA